MSALFTKIVSMSVRPSALFALLVVFVLAGPVVVQAAWIDLGDDGVTTRVLESDGQRTVFEVIVGGFEAEELTIDGATYRRISLPREGHSLTAGEPDLPYVRRALLIPDDRAMAVRVLDEEHVDLPGLPIAPSKGNLLRTTDPAQVPYTFGDIYRADAAFPAQIVQADEPHILRDYRGQVIQANVFRYTPSTETLRVYTRLVIEVAPDGPGKVNVLERSRDLVKQDPQFAKLYADHFLNFQDFESTRYTPVAEEGGLLIIAYDSFLPYLQPLVQWKQQKGIPTQLVPVSVTGSSYTAIRSYIQDAYETDGIGYVLLVGDAAQIPKYGSNSDPEYSLIAGSDSYPDVFVGRFSAENPTQVTTQVNRTIAYERDQAAGSTWPQYGTGIASNEGPGHFGEYDYEHEDLIRADLLGYGYLDVDQLYGSASSSQVAAAINAGRGIVNYTGHGSSVSWVTTGFNVNDVNALTNTGQWPFIMSVACNNGTFDSSTCFAETWLRADSGGEPTGAIATYMSYISQSWEPPMYAQDEAADLLVADEMRTVGGLWFNGSCEMIDVTGTSGVNEFKNWTIFGDPSVCVRTKAAETMTIDHMGVLLIGMDSYDVTIAGVEGALCALYADGVLYGTATTNAAGVATVTMAESLSSVMTLTLTVTAYNKVTVIEDVDVLPPEGPYLVSETVSVLDGSGDADGILDSGETVDLTLQLENVGVEDATGVSAVLSTTDPYVTVTSSEAAYPDIAVSGLALGLDPFALAVSGAVPDGHRAELTVTIAADQGSWEETLLLPVQAPQLAVYGLQLNDAADGNADGGADAGETVTVSVYLANSGTGVSSVLTGALTSSDTGLVIQDADGSCGAIAPSETGVVGSFVISVLPECPQPSVIDLELQVAGAADFETTLTCELWIGGWFDDLETDRGWTAGASDDDATSGIWERVDPVVATYDGHTVQSGNDHTPGSGRYCYVTGNTMLPGVNGMENVDEGKTTLTTPVFELATAESATVSYWRWYSNSWGTDPDNDWWTVEVTADGETWVVLEQTQTTAAAWTQMTFELTEYVTLSNQIQLRFVAADEGFGSVVEAGVDDFLLDVAWPLGVAPVGEDVGTPRRLTLGANYPNPFNPKTTLSFDLPQAGPVDLAVYDITGRRVATLVDAELTAGRHTVTWLGRDQFGRQVASGIYFSRLIQGGEILTRKMTLLK